MSENKNTIYNQLSQMLGQKNYEKNPDTTVISTSDPQEFYIKKLEKHQSHYLDVQSGKLKSFTNQTNLAYQSTRLSAYVDFEQMEYYPILHRALDLYAEEATTKDEFGMTLNIFSQSPRIKGILEELFYNRLNILANLPMWIRNTCKYGDNFVYLEMKDKVGVIGCQQLRNSELERIDGGMYAATGEHKAKVTKFKYRSANVEMMEWQIAHFRLLFDDRRIPYGVSMMEKVRRIWRNILIAEDAMLTYRVVRAPERRVFKIFVGNMTASDVEPYINKIMDKIKRRPVIGNNGSYNSKYNVMSIDDDYVIPVRSDANESSVETLAGASNMSDIADIEYLKNEMVAALGIPLQYLNYGGETTGGGEGKNLAMSDIRFARTITRIQESIISTLNKIATTHLYLLGLKDEIGNFTLSLNNPSSQAETLRLEQETARMTLFREATTKNDTGFSPYSNLMAMKKILKLSDTEIIQNLEEQRLEKAASAELENTAQVIQKSGLFDRVDKMYGNPQNSVSNTSDVGGGFDAGGTDELGGGDLGGEDFGATDVGDIGDDGGGLTEMIKYIEKGKKTVDVQKYFKFEKVLTENKKLDITEDIDKVLGDLKELQKIYDS